MIKILYITLLIGTLMIGASACASPRRTLKEGGAQGGDKRETEIRELVNAAPSRDSLLRLSEEAEARWYAPGSQEMDEGLYGMWVKALLESPLLEEADKVRPMAQLEEMSKNPIGQRATDIDVERPDGTHVGLLSLLAGEGQTLVLFYDPDCDHCDEAIERLTTEGYEGAVRIVAVCVEGDADRWHERILSMPDEVNRDEGTEWIHAYVTPTLGMDADEEIYVLRAMPTAYLLGRDGKVVAKNITF